MKSAWLVRVPICMLLLLEITPSRVAAQGRKETKTGDPTDRSSAPSCKDCPAPRWPSGARKPDMDFPPINLDILISAEGDVKDIRVVSAPGDNFADEAIKAVRKWKFKPAHDKDGKPFLVRVGIQVKFNFVSGPRRC